MLNRARGIVEAHALKKPFISVINLQFWPFLMRTRDSKQNGKAMPYFTLKAGRCSSSMKPFGIKFFHSVESIVALHDSWYLRLQITIT